MTSLQSSSIMFRFTSLSPKLCSSISRTTFRPTIRAFTTTSTFKMPETLTKEEVEKGQDPSVTKQWDNDTPVETRFDDFYKIADGLKIGIMGTYRNGVGVCLPVFTTFRTVC